MPTEYERVRSHAESDAIKAESMTAATIRHARQVGVAILHGLGLTPERVWELTRGMRRVENGGAA